MFDQFLFWLLVFSGGFLALVFVIAFVKELLHKDISGSMISLWVIFTVTLLMISHIKLGA